jgi:hypothetical protein
MKKNKNSERAKYEESLKFVAERLDSVYIMNKLIELDKLKLILLDKD